MTRSVPVFVGSALHTRSFPSARSWVLPGVQWGEPSTVFTPAYWLYQFWLRQGSSNRPPDFRSRHGLVSEVVFCMLGGHGISAEVATAAYEKCRQRKLIERRTIDMEAWRVALTAPLQIGQRVIRYRFPNRKAMQIAAAMRVLDRSIENLVGLELRAALLRLPGVGWKTASWIVRNVQGNDDVAILDIHIMRAGLLCGLFKSTQHLGRDYLDMESRFLLFASKLGVRPSILDGLMWSEMRDSGDLVLRLLQERSMTNRARLGAANGRRNFIVGPTPVRS